MSHNASTSLLALSKQIILNKALKWCGKRVLSTDIRYDETIEHNLVNINIIVGSSLFILNTLIIMLMIYLFSLTLKVLFIVIHVILH